LSLGKSLDESANIVGRAKSGEGSA
jgi:hypothetical protein